MKKYLLILLFLVLGFVFANTASAQDFWHHHNGVWHNHQHTTYHYHYYNNVGYYPVVQWYPEGVWMNVGPTYVLPNGNVRFGMNIGFSSYRGYSTFNFANGQTGRFRR